MMPDGASMFSDRTARLSRSARILDFLAENFHATVPDVASVVTGDDFQNRKTAARRALLLLVDAGLVRRTHDRPSQWRITARGRKRLAEWRAEANEKAEPVRVDRSA
jgi:hypothetical protein